MRLTAPYLSAICWIAFVLSAPAVAQTAEWQETGYLAAPEARQAAAADERHVFAVGSEVVAKYDRTSGRLLARSQGRATHLNSAFLHEGQLYLAHSNYPEKPERSQIMRVDPESMRLESWHDFGASDGSLTWCAFHDGAWWCHFAFYGNENRKSYLARFDDDWREVARWTFPPRVVEAFGRYSASGGIWRGGQLLTTGHDRREIYVLALPEEGSLLHYVATQPAPFAGQGIAHDPATGGLVGVDRAQRRVVFARPK